MKEVFAVKTRLLIYYKIPFRNIQFYYAAHKQTEQLGVLFEMCCKNGQMCPILPPPPPHFFNDECCCPAADRQQSINRRGQQQPLRAYFCSIEEAYVLLTASNRIPPNSFFLNLLF